MIAADSVLVRFLKAHIQRALIRGMMASYWNKGNKRRGLLGRALTCSRWVFYKYSRLIRALIVPPPNLITFSPLFSEGDT